MSTSWLDQLVELVEKRRVLIIRLDEADSESLRQSRRGFAQFSLARTHASLGSISVPTVCLVATTSDDEEELHFGRIRSRGAVSTLESRISVESAVRLAPDSDSKLPDVIPESRFADDLRRRLATQESEMTLPSKLSGVLVRSLAEVGRNSNQMQRVVEPLLTPRRYDGNAGMQEDAVATALAVFGIGSREAARSLDIITARPSALQRVSVMEDSVIEHDARSIPGLDLVQSDVTGRAIFEKGNERLEVFTANRRPLEQCFGVDLIYLNRVMENIVMVQYKMLEPVDTKGKNDWVYRPDIKLEKEIERMKVFACGKPPGPLEYRLNRTHFYLKFVKRDGSIKSGGIVMPLDHFETLSRDPSNRGPQDGLRISFDALHGRYLRQGGLIDLIRSGYIGSHADTTKSLMIIVEAVLNEGRAIVAAIHSRT